MSQSQIQMVNESWIVGSVHCSQIRLRLQWCLSGGYILCRIIIFRLFVIIIRQHHGRVHFPLITWKPPFPHIHIISSFNNKKRPKSAKFVLNKILILIYYKKHYMSKNILKCGIFLGFIAEAVFCSRRTTRLVDAWWREMGDRSLQFFYPGVG